MEDRFGKIAKNYDTLIKEMFAEEGLDYNAMETSVFGEVSKVAGFQNMTILDLGCGDGETSRAFIEAGCQNITGLDLNQEMLDRAASKFGGKITLVQGDAADMQMFAAGQFPVIISGTCIHNIPKSERSKVWAEILRLRPNNFVCVDKIANPDPQQHAQELENEIQAIDTVYRKRHGLEEEALTWEAHYSYDEQEKMEFSEIQAALGAEYDISLVLETGMMRTLSCVRK